VERGTASARVEADAGDVTPPERRDAGTRLGLAWNEGNRIMRHGRTRCARTGELGLALIQALGLALGFAHGAVASTLDRFGVDTATLSGLSFSETGNEISGDYTISTYTYAVDFGGSEGFLAELEAPIVGNNGNTCPDSGAILVTGSDDTQGKGTIVPGISVDNDIRVEYKDSTGTFVEATGSPVPCTTVFQ